MKAHAGAHVAFAVAIDEGLITPVIRDTDRKSLVQISTEVRELAKKAKDRKLTPAEFTGGTFCVSNLGMMGIDRFSAIINPPNAAILAVGTTVKKPVVKNDTITIGQRMSLTLSCDHRVVDGAVGAQFLAGQDAFRVRMVEQICYIRAYRRQVLAEEGRRLTPREAALEWVTRHAASFPEACVSTH